MKSNTYDYTASGTLPEFLSMRLDKEGNLVVTVRSPVVVLDDGFREPGEFGKMVLPKDKIPGLIGALLKTIPEGTILEAAE